MVTIFKKALLSLWLATALTQPAPATEQYVKELAYRLWEAGKPYDLSLTLLAIASVESRFGKVKVNLKDPSCGVTMIHITYFLKRNNLPINSFTKNRACQDLMDNDDLAIAEAVAILQYWKSKLCSRWGCSADQWLQVWARYNGKGERAEAYAKKVKAEVQRLKSSALVKSLSKCDSKCTIGDTK